MQPAEISPEVESSIVSLAGSWAKEWADNELPSANLTNLDKWENVFGDRFSAYYATILKSILRAREERQNKAKT